MKRQNLLKSTLCLLMALVCNVMWAQIEVSTSVETPENTYSLLSKNGAYMSVGTGATQYRLGRFAFYAAEGENAYKIYSVDGEKWVSYTKADSYGGGANKASLVDAVENAQAWYVVANGDYYNIAPLKNDGTLGGQYWNFHGGAGPSGKTYIYDDNKTVGFYSEAGDGGSLWKLEKLTLATEEQVNAAKALIAVAPGYPKTTTSVYAAMNALTYGVSSTKHIDLAVLAYKIATDIILPEDGKAYTLTSVMGKAANATRYYMKYENGKKVTVSTTSTDASVFVCKELSTTNANEKKYAFITADGHILTWIGNNDGNAYKENNNIYGYSSNYAIEYNGLSDWNDITVKKNGTNAEDFGYLRLVGRRNSGAYSSIIANSENRFDQANDGYWFNTSNSSAWILTEVEHNNTDAENLTLAKIDAKLHVTANASNLGELIGQSCYFVNDERVYNAADVNTAIDAATTVDAVNAIKNSYAVYEGVKLTSKDEFESGGVYTFVTERGWMGATETCSNVISTAKTSHGVTGGYYDSMFQWVVYISNNGNYYLYNLGKQQFMGVQSTNNASIPFAAKPAGKKLTFKDNGQTTGYPIMFSTDNAGVVNHSTSYGDGLITWTGGWNTLNDGGSNHKVTLVSKLPEATLQEIAAKVEAYDKRLYVTAEVEGSWENNPNTHFGSVRATASTGTLTSKLKTTPSVAIVDYDGLNETTIDFTRAYRGFEFQGYSFGGVDLGKSFTLTDEQKASITAENPLVAKFTATEAVTLFYDDDEFSYRIPAIATTSTGRLIAVSDYRYSLDDIGRYNFGTANPGIDLVIRMSDDNGKTWGATKTIAKGSCKRGTNDCAYGDAAIAVVGQKVLVMGAAGDVMFGNGNATTHNRTVRIFSEDGGENWTAPQDISETFFINADATINSAYSLFFGSGMLAVDENYNGTGNARIYGAVLVKKNGTNNGIYVVYTDDFGLTWSILGGSQTHIASNDEPKVEILPSGQILLSIRRGGGRQFNVFTYTDKGTNAGSWNGNADGCSNGGSNTCNGEIFLLDAKKADGTAVKLLLQSQPKGGSGQYDRRDVTIWYKEVDNAAYTSAQIAGNWIEGMQVSTQQSAYSTMSLQEDGKIAFFFEEAPCYGDDQAKGYCMVYVPLTIENITKGHYFSPDADLSTIRTINVELTDAQGNEYRDQVTSSFGGIATALTTKYPFITIGDNANLESDGETFTYTNSVTLPFKVSNEETTVWHNIYWPSNQGSGYPIYLSASAANDTYVPKVTETVTYGNSTFNTADYANKISWAVYQVGDGFTFKLKNKLTGKFIQVTSVVSSDAQNVKYVDEAEATAFELVPDVDSYMGDYALKASVNSTEGYLCSSSAGYGYATHHSSKGHQGAWVKFAEAPDFESLIADINEALTSGLYGNSLGQYKPTDEVSLEMISEAMENSNTVKLNVLNSYKEVFENATLNMPQAGQYFRVAYDYGGSVGKLYMQSTASTVKGVAFTAETGNASIWYFQTNGDSNNACSLYAYTVGLSKNLREYGEERGLHTNKTTAVFSASSRVKGKYNLQCGSWVHANASNGNYYSDHCGSNGCVQHDLILEEVDMRPSTIVSTISEHKMGTFYANEAVTIPDGVTAYVATTEPVMEDGVGTIAMTPIKDRIIPAETGVLICGEQGDYKFARSAEAGTAVEGNFLKGYAGAFEYDNVTLADGYNTYVLTVKNEEAGFYKKTSGFKVYYNKAYLQVPATLSAQSIRLRFEGSTDIETPEFTIQNSECIYDLMGRRVLNPTKGMYIVNGRKVVIK